MITILLLIWLVFFVLHAIYKYLFQYRKPGEAPYSYKGVKKFLSYAEFITLWITVGVLTSVSYWFLLLIPFSLATRFLINFLCFKRASDQLYNLYMRGGKMTSEMALKIANDTINRKIETKEMS